MTVINLDLNSTKTIRHVNSDAITSRIDAVVTPEQRLHELERIDSLPVPPAEDYWGRSISASAVGDECARRVQLSVWPTFHPNAPHPKKAPLTEKDAKVFARGHATEALMVEWMARAGFGISTEAAREGDRRQHGFITASGQIKGYADGVFLAHGEKNLWEHKTLGAKGWRSVYNNGVVKAYPKYDAQVQLLMAYMNAEAALFTILNAETGALYAESVPLHPVRAQAVSDRAVWMLKATRAGDLLPKVANGGDVFPCGWCRFKGECWG